MFEGISNTLFVPLVARVAISKEFPEYFYDPKALELVSILPKNASRGASQYSNMASVARYFIMDKMVSSFAGMHEKCNVVYLGAGLETAYDRLSDRLHSVNWFQIDLPEVIEARRRIFGTRDREVLIAHDLFALEWTDYIDRNLPTLLVASGVFQYFFEKDILKFIKACSGYFMDSEIIFDATSESGLAFTNWFIRRTGNHSAQMHFGINDGVEFAEKCGLSLLAENILPGSSINAWQEIKYRNKGINEGG